MEREQFAHNPLVKHYGLPFVEGALAGLIATVPMTIFMLAAQRILPQLGYTQAAGKRSGDAGVEQG